jgi:NADH-quinone oxidoreductase subunit E
MAVRRLHPDQPPQFAFTAENLAWAHATIAKYPPGKEASAVLPLMWRAQEQSGGWLPEPAIRAVCDLLGMAHIRGLEIATFYTQFQLAPIGTKAHVQVCGTTPCMLRGSRELIAVCHRRIGEQAHVPNADGTLSWEEVECIGVCANAPVVQIGKDTFEDLTPEQLDAVLDGFLEGHPPKPGSQIGRTASCPEGGPTTLSDASLYDGSTIGAWKKRFEATAVASEAVETSPASALASPAHKSAVAEGVSPSSPNPPAGAKPQPHPAALAAIANAGLAKELEARGTGAPLAAGELDRIKADMRRGKVPSAGAPPPSERELLKTPRGGKGDDLSLIKGMSAKMVEKLNAIGIWHFAQIAAWTPGEVAWLENQVEGIKSRITRDKWIEQAQKLASGWRPETKAGERPKG